MGRIAPLIVAGALSLGIAAPAQARDRDCSRQSCTEHGGHNGDTCFSPCSIVIVPPNVPLLPHNDPPPKRTQSFIPPNPSKIPQQIVDFIKFVSDFVAGVAKFAI